MILFIFFLNNTLTTLVPRYWIVILSSNVWTQFLYAYVHVKRLHYRYRYSVIILLLLVLRFRKSRGFSMPSRAWRGRVCGTGRQSGFLFKLFFFHGKISVSSRCFFACDDWFVTAILRNYTTSSCTRVNTSVLVNVKPEVSLATTDHKKKMLISFLWCFISLRGEMRDQFFLFLCFANVL